MSAYLPRDPTALVGVAVLLVVTLGAGYGLTRLADARWARAGAWALLAMALAGALALVRGEPPGVRMLVLIPTLLYAMKAVVGVETIAAGGPRLTLARWLGYAALWVGMRPAPFTSAWSPSPAPGARRLAARAAASAACGVALVLMAGPVFAWAQVRWGRGAALAVATLLLLPGLCFILHYGVCDLLAAWWRWRGVSVDPLHRRPLRSRSLAEFWGRRWNSAFTEMMSVGLYRPLSRVGGRALAVAAVFLLSGVLHEAAISVPVDEGYGLPSAYFALHGALVLLERRWESAGRPIDRLGWLARAWTVFWIVAPLPVLFHPPFLRGVVWPLAGIG